MQPAELLDLSMVIRAQMGNPVVDVQKRMLPRIWLSSVHRPPYSVGWPSSKSARVSRHSWYFKWQCTQNLDRRIGNGKLLDALNAAIVYTRAEIEKFARFLWPFFSPQSGGVLRRFISVDETQAHHYTPETKK